MKPRPQPPAPTPSSAPATAAWPDGTANSILVIVWHLLADPTIRYRDLGPEFVESRIRPERRKQNHIRQLEALGYTVTLTPAA